MERKTIEQANKILKSISSLEDKIGCVQSIKKNTMQSNSICISCGGVSFYIDGLILKEQVLDQIENFFQSEKSNLEKELNQL